MFTTIISVDELKALKAQAKDVIIFDCSFDLLLPKKGQEQYQEGHITGAYYADLNHHLSALNVGVDRLCGGRHPLPTREHLAQFFAQFGIQSGAQVVAYDRQNNTFAPRLWWLLKWLGHANVAVLDGGFNAWKSQDGAVDANAPVKRHAMPFELAAPLVIMRTCQEVKADLYTAAQTVVDARALERYLGKVEPLDAAAGHIPGALSRPFMSNLDAQGFFKSDEKLKKEWLALLAERPIASVVQQCGSGVTAANNVLSMALAGLGYSPLYAGSWSEWSSYPDNPIEKS